MAQFEATRRTLPGLDICRTALETGFSLWDRHTGAAWLSSARVVRCSVKSGNERNPCCQLPSGEAGYSGETARVKREEGADDVKSVWPLRPGLHTCYNGRYNEKRNREVEQICENRPQFGLESATRLHEAGIASKGVSATAP